MFNGKKATALLFFTSDNETKPKVDKKKKTQVYKSKTVGKKGFDFSIECHNQTQSWFPKVKSRNKSQKSESNLIFLNKKIGKI